MLSSLPNKFNLDTKKIITEVGIKEITKTIEEETITEIISKTANNKETQMGGKLTIKIMIIISQL